MLVAALCFACPLQVAHRHPVQTVGWVDESLNPRPTVCSRAVALVEVEELVTSPVLPMLGQLVAISMTQELR